MCFEPCCRTMFNLDESLATTFHVASHGDMPSFTPRVTAAFPPCNEPPARTTGPHSPLLPQIPFPSIVTLCSCTTSPAHPSNTPPAHGCRLQPPPVCPPAVRAAIRAPRPASSMHTHAISRVRVAGGGIIIPPPPQPLGSVDGAAAG